MKRNLLVPVVLIALAVIGAFALQDKDTVDEVITQPATQQIADTNAQNCVSEDCLEIEDLEYPAGKLTPEVVAALDTALDDEYKARATYESVIDSLGSVRPFSMIIRAEEQHISSLKALYDKYGLGIPVDPYVNVQVESTKSANCSIGVQAEIVNAALYRDELLPVTVDYPDITNVFTSLMNASQDKHLPAFENCTS